MIDQDTIDEILAANAARRADRRRFIKMAGATGAAIGGGALLAACGNNNDDEAPPTSTPSSTPTPTASANDVAILNFALNLEYLEGNYYSFGAFGSGINATLQGGTGTQGAVVGGRQVQFGDATVASYIREIASDENAHILFLRNQLGSLAIAQPAINIDGSATGAFTMAARAAGVVGPTETFDPYASDDNFLLGAMLLTDVGVTAYKGAATLIDSKVFLEAAAGILAVEAYHSGLLRTLLYVRGTTMPTMPSQITKTGLISNARDMLDGTTTSSGPPQLYADDDQGIANGSGFNSATASNIVPSDVNGIVFGRTVAQVHNIAYLTNTRKIGGGFFPNGTNNPNNELRYSANNA